MKHLCLSALLGLSLLVACSKQNEGATCLLSNGDGDCDDGLVCTDSSKLANEWDSAYPADRCCPEDGNSSNDNCKLRDSTTESSSSEGGASASGGASSEGGASASGGASSEGGASASGGATA